MDESMVREHAEAHGRAVVEGDLRRAAQDLTDAVMPHAQRLMSERFPTKLTDVEILDVESLGARCRARMRYSGEGRSVTVESVWADEGEGRPKIVELDAV
jgi:hypothetical protein